MLLETIRDISELISDIIPVDKQMVSLQADNNPSRQFQPKFDWHWDFFEATFKQLQSGGFLPEFPHIFAYCGRSFSTTQLTELPKGQQLNRFKNLKEFNDYLNNCNLKISQNNKRCQMISSKTIHRAPNDRPENFLLIAFRSKKEIFYFHQLSNHFIKQDAAKARLISPRYSYQLPIPAVFL